MMKIKHLSGCLLLFLALFISNNVTANLQVQNFQKANAYYNEAIYDSALMIYTDILSQGYSSDELYYNLGNTYFKLKDIPSAILYYEKALKINSSDEDTQHNLQIANNMIVDKIEVLPELFFRVWWNTFYTLLSANAWAYISVVILLFTLLSAYLYFTSFNIKLRKLAFFSGIILLFLTVISFGLASQKHYYTQQTNEAIVFVPTITIKSSPAQSSIDLFVLHEGTKLRILDNANGWTKIKIANGSIGWIPQDVIKGI